MMINKIYINNKQYWIEDKTSVTKVGTPPLPPPSKRREANEIPKFALVVSGEGRHLEFPDL